MHSAPMQGQEMAALWLQKLKQGEDDSQSVQALARLNLDDLANELNSDSRKLAFWINVYNAWAYSFLSKRPFSLRSFQQRSLCIGGRQLSLNDIEHGLLRRSRLWWSPWFGRKIWPSAFERRNRVDRLDPRIHFALNCAAASCPPIRFYVAATMDQQLDLAAAAYLEQTLVWEPVSQTLTLPGIMRMFRSDFGGLKGMIRFQNRYTRFQDPEFPPRIVFSAFDRSKRVGEFV